MSGGVILNPTSAIGVVGSELTLRLSQPRPECRLAGELRISVSLIRPDNTSIEVAGEIEAHDPRTGLSAVTIRFTPEVSGSWQAIATFEPSLGRVQVPVQVANLRASSPRHTTELPVSATSCAIQPWRTSAGLVLCEVNGLIYAQRDAPDGGYATFEGDQLSVLGNTVWFAQAQTLVRSTDTGAELRRDALVATPGEAPRFSAFTNESTAIRWYQNTQPTQVLRYDWLDGGLISSNVVLTRPRISSVFVTDAAPWGVQEDSAGLLPWLCDLSNRDAGCRPLNGQLMGVEQGNLWVSDGSASRVELQVAPLAVQRSVSLQLPNEWRVSTEESRLWVDRQKLLLDDFARDLVVSFDGTQLVLTSYGPGRVLGTRGDWVVLSTSKTRTVTFAEF